jgi:trehalose/maltose transport system substrate-binding protein
MFRRTAAIAASVLAFSFVIPTAAFVSAKSGPTHLINTSNCSAVPPSVKYPAAPRDPFAKQDKKYAGQTITYYSGSVGSDHDADVPLCVAFEKSTGIKVNLQEMPSDSSATISNLENVFTSGSSSIDVTRLDVVWPGLFGRYLVDIKKAGGADVGLEDKNILRNDTVGGKLRALPYQGDFGLLYFRKDLLKKYHVSVPTTWSQLTADAKKIQKAVRKSNKNFWGFVFQGNSYEGLTCNALEWIESYGGGSIITPKGKVTIDNAKARQAISLAKSWVGSISPKGVTTYQEGQTHGAFLAGNAAFARNWPYMWSLQTGTAVQGKVGVAPLPHGPSGKSSATTGGWQIGVSEFSKHKGAAEAWARYYASYQVQIWRAEHAGIAPTMPKVAGLKAVKKANAALGVAAKTTHVVRPSTVLAGNYAKGSAYIYQGINSILTGSSVSSMLSTIQSELQSLHP